MVICGKRWNNDSKSYRLNYHTNSTIPITTCCSEATTSRYMLPSQLHHEIPLNQSILNCSDHPSSAIHSYLTPRHSLGWLIHAKRDGLAIFIPCAVLPSLLRFASYISFFSHMTQISILAEKSAAFRSFFLSRRKKKPKKELENKDLYISARSTYRIHYKSS